ncbi:hypothetical protein PRECH8_09960 [Insulibacter thermoxylanivorax]|uniref:Uncharacterized protein n=1 Tax=Insulibacter thermoxylanivorax TaxID=2749268 RepID=A0A916VGQ1_9BACL|nr:endolytic transglycosylase MltG [Insulibacter thermoxylanivorax]GFR37700.1 hypothetical protein PRECH8_09960 [Insulibacter thermoxylanivorax]
MNKKSIYWLGLGSGLITGALLIRLLTFGASPEMLDEAALQEAAARYGYRLVSEYEKITIAYDRTIRSIYIPPEMNLEEIAELLTQAKLLDAQEAFLTAAADLPDERSIQPGYYEFMNDPTFAELLDVLTSGVRVTAAQDESAEGEDPAYAADEDAGGV